MIARAHRFHGHNSLRHVYAHGQTIHGPLCTLRYAANPRRQTWRAAVIVSKKTHKSAVVRNRIRRRIYEIIRTHLQPTAMAIDIVFIVYSDQMASLPAGEVEAAIMSQLQKAGLVQSMV
jgi:ribonuclease P protein component